MSSYKRNTGQRKQLRSRYKRSQAACYICGQAIDYDLKTPHPDSFELDHVQALARGGADAPDNLRPAHRHPPLQLSQTSTSTRAHRAQERRARLNGSL